MIKMNGTELSARQFLLLEKLVEAHRSGADSSSLAVEELYPDENSTGFNSWTYRCYEKFFQEGFFMGEFDFIMDLPKEKQGFLLGPAAFDFVDDFRISEEIENERKDDQRKHDYRIARYGVIGGGLVGLFSGALGSWLFDWLAYFVSLAS